MSLIIAIVLIIILFGMHSKDKALTNKYNKETTNLHYKDNRPLENALTNKLFNEFEKIRADKNYISDSIPLEYQSYFRNTPYNKRDKYNNIYMDFNQYVKARVAELLFEQGYKPELILFVKQYDKMRDTTIDERDKDRIWGVFNHSVLPKIKAYNNDYTNEKRQTKQDLINTVNEIIKIKQQDET